MILNKEEIEASGIVVDLVDASLRSTTYDATIGKFILEGEVIDKPYHMLEKRGVIWVTSAEKFNFDNKHTGLATLKTTWTHKGLLALNVGIIDPGWNGPLATALVNFSGKKIRINKGDPFFRVAIMQHHEVQCPTITKNMAQYVEDISERSRLFTPTFLDTQSLVGEVSQKIFRLPGWAIGIGFAAIILTMIAIFAPVALSVYSDHKSETAQFYAIEKRLEKLESQSDLHRSIPKKQALPLQMTKQHSP